MLLLALAFASGCRQRVDPSARSGPEAGAAFDSLLVSAGLPRPFSMSGDAVIDVEQFRFRGHFRLERALSHDVVIELGGSTLFGGHREDVVISLSDDTLRVFDRERGRFYEGAELDDMIADATGARAHWARVVADVLALPHAPESVEGLAVDAEGASGKLPRGPFRVVVEEGRMTRATWPDPIVDGTFSDRLEVRYRWQGSDIDEITARLPERGWRVRWTDSN